MQVRDKVILITGASMGIGEATARRLARGGARLALVARSAERLAELAGQLAGSLPITADLSQEDQVRRMVATAHQHFGRIDVLINNAGAGLWGNAAEVSLADYRKIMELNVFGPLAAMQAVIPIMRAQGGGVIINISSGVSRMYIPGLSAYASTKYALNALSLTARAELAADNIRVGVMLPGLTATDFGKNAYGPPPSFAGRGGGESVEQVAEKILEAITSEAAEVLADILRH